MTRTVARYVQNCRLFRLTKLRHVVPCKESLTAEGAADLFLKYVWKLHGLPKIIVSYRGPHLGVQLFQRPCQDLGIHQNILTADNAQTDGRTEQIREVVDTYLRAYCSCQQDDWSEWLPVV